MCKQKFYIMENIKTGLTHANPKKWSRVMRDDGSLHRVRLSIGSTVFHSSVWVVLVPKSFRPLSSRNFQPPHCKIINKTLATKNNLLLFHDSVPHFIQCLFLFCDSTEQCLFSGFSFLKFAVNVTRPVKEMFMKCHIFMEHWNVGRFWLNFKSPFYRRNSHRIIHGLCFKNPKIC